MFEIFFSLLLRYTFNHCDKGVFVCNHSDGRLFNLPRLLNSNTKVSEVLVSELLFADDAALTAQSDLLRLINTLYDACNEFGLTIN